MVCLSLVISQAYADQNSLDSPCIHMLQVDGQILFVCPAELVNEERIVLEACWDGAWSNPFVLPLMAAVVPDNLDSSMAEFELSAPQRQEVEERLLKFLGKQHSPLGFPMSSVVTDAIRRVQLPSEHGHQSTGIQSNLAHSLGRMCTIFLFCFMISTKVMILPLPAKSTAIILNGKFSCHITPMMPTKGTCRGTAVLTCPFAGLKDDEPWSDKVNEAESSKPRSDEVDGPFAVPHMADDLDSTMAEYPAPQRQEWEERLAYLARFLGEQHGAPSFSMSSVSTNAVWRMLPSMPREYRYQNTGILAHSLGKTVTICFVLYDDLQDG